MKRYLYIFTLKTFFLLLGLVMGLVFMSCGGGSGNGGGNGGPSSPPAKPENLMPEASSGQITLTWDAQPGETYTLFYSTAAEIDVDSATTMSFPNVTPPHSHTDLPYNTTYYYRLTAMNSLGTSEPSEEVSATTPPLTLTAAASNGQVTLTWDAQTSVTFTLFYSTTASVDVDSSATMRFSDVTTPYSHTDLAYNTTYYYRLTASRSSVVIATSEEVSATTPPLILTAAASNGQVTLTWDAQTSVTFTLFYSTTASVDVDSSATMRFSDVTSPHSHTDLAYNTTYYYKLTASRSSVVIATSEEVSATTPPLILTAAASNGQVTLTWDAQTSVTFTLFYSTTASVDVDSSATMRFSDVTPPHSHTDLTNNTTYYYRLTASRSSVVIATSEEVSATPRLPVTEISAGRDHACALVNGFAKCWGEVDNGPLGNGSSSGADQTTPQQVMGLTSGVMQIATGEAHTCALVNGSVKCWGYNWAAQLGRGGTTSSSIPVQVTNLTSGVTHISAGQYHTCAVVNDGGAFCWGFGRDGRLGDGATTQRDAPVPVMNLSGVTQISAGGEHTCAVMNGAAFCWGRGGQGRLGRDNNNTSSSDIPVQVMGLTSGVTQISAGGSHTCAVVDGGAKCWGSDNNGQLGSGNNSGSNTPQQVMGLTSGVTQISAGRAHTCAVAGGRALCWGRGDKGQLGRGNTGSNTPQQVMGLTSGVTQISAASDHTCAVVNDRAFCWGRGDNGRLGDGAETQRNAPVQVHDDIYD